MELKTVNVVNRSASTATGYDRYGRPVRRHTTQQPQEQYQYDSTVRKPKHKEHRSGYDYSAERRYREEFDRKERERRLRRKQYLRRKKENALTFRNLMMITIGSFTVVAMCIFYLGLMSTISSQSKLVNSKQRELVTMQEENNARYNHLNNSMSLEEVRDRAVNDLGMVNASNDQVITYSDPSTDYVTQNESIPK